MRATSEREPLVTIVTACRNAERFLEQTICSVLAQDYPRIEYIVMDGASSDGTLDILKKYDGQLQWHSGPDRGVADAINQGFTRGNGEILAFLNADDIYLPGAVSTAVHNLVNHAGVYGNAWWIDEHNARIFPYPVRDFDRAALERECFICQPASFFRREAFENVGGLDPSLQLTFDYDFWLRLTRTYSLLRLIRIWLNHACIAIIRRWASARQSFAKRFRSLSETAATFRSNGFICTSVSVPTKGTQFFERFQPSVLRYLESLPVGLWRNPSSIARYLADWSSVMTWQALRRRL